ncbi:putative Na+/H+ antiporter [Caballeronia sp. LZ024]|nr:MULTISPECIES: putative Na+/H+ antiporter [unclassified Caballeronia]MDR5755031.1 putative Na+/H+ antiporter [Caballeronia sp. LZ024]MDR5845593.1 putative Na+/H+ antiporter [Caballeronia sp. LZ031]
MGRGFLASTFGWKAALAVLVNTTVFVALIARHIQAPSSDGDSAPQRNVIPFSVAFVHVGFLIAIVRYAHQQPCSLASSYFL